MPDEATPGDAREEIVQHLAAMRAFALNLTRNDATADDLVQDTILKAWKNIDHYKAGTNLRAWLFTILRNTFYSDRRKARRDVSDSDGLFTASLAVKPHHDGTLAMQDFLKAFAELPDEQREALTLVGALGFTYSDAADMCGVATGTMKSRVNRGRQQLIVWLGLNADEALELTDRGTMAVLTAGRPVVRL